MVDHAGSTDLTPGWLTYPRLALGLCSFGWFFVQGVRLIIPALALPIKESLVLSNAGFGVAVTVLWATYALLQFPGGLASDSLGFRTALVVGSVVTAAVRKTPRQGSAAAMTTLPTTGARTPPTSPAAVVMPSARPLFSP